MERGLKNSSLDVSALESYLRFKSPKNVKNVLENKNEFDPGHSHFLPPRNFTVLNSVFESLDGWTIGGVGTEVITRYIGGVEITTGVV